MNARLIIFGATWLVAAAFAEPLIRGAVWATLWLAHVACDYPAPPVYTAWAPGP